MLEETGTVVAVNGQWLWVETQAHSACSHCGSGSCSSSVIGKWFGVRRNRLRLPNDRSLQPGQQVVIGIPEQVLVSVALRAYLLPVLAMLGATVLAATLDFGEPAQALAGLAGLAAGLWLTAVAADAATTSRRCTPRLLGVVGTEIDTTALMRKQA